MYQLWQTLETGAHPAIRNFVTEPCGGKTNQLRRPCLEDYARAQLSDQMTLSLIGSLRQEFIYLNFVRYDCVFWLHACCLYMNLANIGQLHLLQPYATPNLIDVEYSDWLPLLKLFQHYFRTQIFS